MDKRTKEEKSLTFAKEFLDGQFAIMKKFGSAPKLSADKYRKLVKDTQKSFQRLEPLKS